MEANNNEKGMVSATMMAPRTLPRRRKELRKQQHAFGQVVKHGMRGQVHQVATVQERDDLYPGGRMRSFSSFTFS